MDIHEWALIAFTILTQLAAGSFVVLWIAQFLAARRRGEAEADRLADRALLAIIPVLLLGLLASLGHLGNPLYAPRAVLNVGKSWLSREILFAVSFTILGAVYTFVQWKKISTAAVRKVLSLVTALVGIGMVYSMSQIYMVRTVPIWNTVITSLSFFTTTFQLGTIAVGAAFVVAYKLVLKTDPGCEEAQCDVLNSTIRWIAVASVILLGVQIITVPLLAGHLTSQAVPAAEKSAMLMFGEFGPMLILRLALSFIGAGAFSLFLFKHASKPQFEAVLGTLVLGAFALILVSEVLGRYLFYATNVRVGV